MQGISQKLSDLLPTLEENELEELEKATLSRVKLKLNKEGLDNYFTWVQAVWLTSRNEPLDFEDHKYLIDILRQRDCEKIELHDYIIKKLGCNNCPRRTRSNIECENCDKDMCNQYLLASYMELTYRDRNNKGRNHE